MSIKTSDKVKKVLVHVLKWWVTSAMVRFRDSSLELPMANVVRSFVCRCELRANVVERAACGDTTALGPRNALARRFVAARTTACFAVARVIVGAAARGGARAAVCRALPTTWRLQASPGCNCGRR